MPRQTAEDQIKRLEAKILSIKERAERKKAKKNPAVKFMAMALRSIDKALNSSDDIVLRKALDEARETVASCLTLCGVKKKNSKSTLTPRSRSSSGTQIDTRRLLSFMESNQGSRSEQISAALNTDANTLRPVLQQLIDDGKVRTEGQRRGRRYFASV